MQFLSCYPLFGLTPNKSLKVIYYLYWFLIPNFQLNLIAFSAVANVYSDDGLIFHVLSLLNE